MTVLRAFSLVLVVILSLTARLLSMEPCNVESEFEAEIPNYHQFSKKELLYNPDGSLSQFALDFQAEECKWTADFCLKDSDQDSLTNGDELGDPCCTGSAKRFERVSNPNNATDTIPELISVLSTWNITNMHQETPDDPFNIHLAWDPNDQFVNGAGCAIYVYFRANTSNQWSISTYLGDFDSQYVRGNLPSDSDYVFKFTSRLPDGTWKQSYEFHASTGADPLGEGVGNDCNMTNPQNWSEVFPEESNSTLRIERWQTVYLNQNIKVYTLEILGCLIFDDAADYNVTAEKMFVAGKLQIGTEDQPYEHKATITFTGEKTNTSTIGHGNKMMVVLNNGTLDLHGKDKGENWVRLGQTAEKGARSLYVANSVSSWEVGDEIVVASTDFDHTQAEELTITAVSSSPNSDGHYAIDITPPLGHTHYGEKQYFSKNNNEQVELDERAEVGLLTHNIVLRGDDNSAKDQYGCDTKYLASARSIHIENVEVTACGKLGVLGRYPMHWHVPSTDPNFEGADRDGDYIKHVSVHHTFQRALTIHGAHRVLVEQMVFYHHNGHGLFFEDGIEQNNRIKNCLGLGTFRISDENKILVTERLTNSDSNPATFWISNPNNELEGNVAAGSRSHGFWMDLQRFTMGPSATPYLRPRSWHFGRFDNNVAHSNGQEGINLWHNFHPCERPEEYSTCGSQQNPSIEITFNGLTSYKNRGMGLFGYVLTDLDFGGSIFADNQKGFDFNVLAGGLDSFTVENLVVIGESANKGSPSAWPNSCWNCVHCGDYLDPNSKYHRTVPRSWSRNEKLQGVVFNRDGHLQNIQNVAFFNFEDNCERAASAIGVRNDERSFTAPYNQFVKNGVEFHNAKVIHHTFNDPVEAYAKGSKSDGYRSAVIVDEGGLMTENVDGHSGPDTRIIPNNPLMIDPNYCSLVPEWNMYTCSPETSFRHLEIESTAVSNDLSPINITTGHGDSALLNGFSFVNSFPANWIYRLNTIRTSTKQEYRLEYTSRIGTPDRVQFTFSPNTLQESIGESRFKLKYTVWGPLEIDLKMSDGKEIHLNAYNDTIDGLASYDCQTNILTFDMDDVLQADVSVTDATSTPPSKDCISFDARCEGRDNCNAENQQGRCVGIDECVCRWGWRGMNCSEFHCIHAKGCMGRGVCVGPNICRCNPGFEGDMCKESSQFNLFEVVLGFGDVHLSTMDKKEAYLFNSIGEFYLLKDSSLAIQSRLVPCQEDSTASCLKAIAVRGSESDSSSKIMIEGVGTKNVTIYVDGQERFLTTDDPKAPNDVNGTLDEIQYQYDPETGEKVAVDPADVTRTSEKPFIRSSDGTVVTTSQEGGYDWYYITFVSGSVLRLRNDGLGFLTVAFSPEQNQQFSGTGVGGLYGNKDNDSENDFTLRDGTVLSSPSSDSIHSTFGESWRVPESESLFEYIEATYSEINDLSFEPTTDSTPIFKSNKLEQQAKELCEQKLKLTGEFLDACLFDIAQTSDLRFAQGSAASFAIRTCSNDQDDCQTLEETVSEICTPWNPDACDDSLSPWTIFGISAGAVAFAGLCVCCIGILSCCVVLACCLSRRRDSKGISDECEEKRNDPNFMNLRLSKDQEKHQSTEEPIQFFDVGSHEYTTSSTTPGGRGNKKSLIAYSEPIEHLEY